MDSSPVVALRAHLLRVAARRRRHYLEERLIVARCWIEAGLEGAVDLDEAIVEAAHHTRLAELDLCAHGQPPGRAA